MILHRRWLMSISIFFNSVVFTPVYAQETLWNALTTGHFDWFFRYRYEQVDDGTPNLASAYAQTLRSAIGYRSNSYRQFDAYLQVENVLALGDDSLYNDGGSNGVNNRAVVVDPEGTELQQGYLRFSGLPKTLLTVGRQEITHRPAPLHRYVGNILWRQNWQSFDAVRAVNLSIPHTLIDYAYVWQVNRIFGSDNPRPDVARFQMNSHFLNIQYSGLSAAKLEAYGYWLEFTTPVSAKFSTATYGLRVSGDKVIAPKTKWLYAGEYAKQLDFANNPYAIGADYWLAELGLNYTFDGLVQNAGLKLSTEYLTGQGGVNAFQTPLGTNHAFQGFADRFLVTPGDGIADYFATLQLKFASETQLSVVYHQFHAEHDHYHYGDEVDLVLEHPLSEHLIAGCKWADYRADGNTLNQSRNLASGQAFDLSKFWLYLQFSL